MRDPEQYQFDLNLLKLTGSYLATRSLSSGNYIETAKSWDAGLRYERKIWEVFGAFADHIIESDIYAGYIQRNNSDLGGKYFLVKAKDLTWSAEAGYRYTFEMRPNDTKTKNAFEVKRQKHEVEKTFCLHTRRFIGEIVRGRPMDVQWGRSMRREFKLKICWD